MSELPKGWVEALVGEIATEVRSGFASGRHNSFGDGIPHLRPMNVSRRGEIDLSEVKFVDPAKDDRRLLPGDVLFNNTNSPALVGKTAVVRRAQDFAFSNHMTRIRLADDINPSFVAVQLHYLWISGQLAPHINNHVNQASISAKKLASQVALRMPPLAEQERIVSAIEEHLSHVDAADAALDHADGLLPTFVAETTRRVMHGESLVGQRRLGVAAAQELPEGWRWMSLDDLGELGRGKSKHRPRNDPVLYGGAYPFIQTGDVSAAKGRVHAFSQRYSEEGLAQSRLWPAGTVVITIAANIADSAILDFEACFPDSVVGLIVDQNLVYPEWVERFIRTAKESLERYAPATAQKNINLTTLRGVRVPTPPLHVQKDALVMLDDVEAEALRVQQEIQRSRSRARRERQAVLTAAFSGKLVRPEPSDEPASTRLDRIRSQRADAKPTRRKRKANTS